MKIMNVLASAALGATLALAGPAFAADYQLDGQLPMYPHGKLDTKESSVTPAAIAHGVPVVLLTADSVATTNAWYASHVAKTCSRQDAAQGTKFACPGGSIMIYAHAGQTQIALVPPLGL
jgi:predicted secreted protein